jgi:hypothetical protein
MVPVFQKLEKRHILVHFLRAAQVLAIFVRKVSQLNIVKLYQAVLAIEEPAVCWDHRARAFLQWYIEQQMGNFLSRVVLFT